jgi:hypothetical protein
MGDSGQFELHGVHTQMKVDENGITSGSGWVGQQTLKFAE